jgi:hypothetical protein
MMLGQSSPVKILIIFTKEEPTVVKFRLLIKTPFGFISANRYIPRIE